MRFILLLVAAMTAFAQTEVRDSERNTDVGYQYILIYTGNNLTTYCKALSLQPTSQPISISAASNANPVSLTSTAHGFNSSALPLVTISGGTGNWTAINGTFTATITGANTFTIPVNSTAFGALAGTITFTTRAPRTNQSVWSVMQLAYDGSNNLTWKGWYAGSPGVFTTCAAAPTQYQ